MSIAEKLTTIAENQQAVYEAGKNAELREFWDDLQYGGTRNDYRYAFYYMPDEHYRPVYDIIGQLKQAYINSTVTNTLVNLVGTGDCSYMFQDVSTLTTVPSIDVSGATGIDALFYGCTNLNTIGELILANDGSNVFTNRTLYRCNSLSNINNIVGVFGNTVDFSYCPLSRESILKVVGALSDTPSGNPVVTFKKSAVNVAFQTTDGANDGSNSVEWENLITPKRNNGWGVGLA